VKALLAGLGLYATSLPLLPQDLVLENSRPTSSLIELYSSEGCSSCPPAEAWMNHLKSAPGLWTEIFPVAFHVDYWDGLGWPDRFARPEYTQRQRDYASRLGQDSVYTPEFVANGLEWRRGWFSGQAIPQGAAQKNGKLSLTVHASDKAISALYLPGTPAAGQTLVLNVALLGCNLVTDVQRGENSGRKLEHDFVVLSLQSAPLTFTSQGTYQSGPVAIKSNTADVPSAVVAWVSGDNGSILQVAGGWLAAAPATAQSN
jgi:hypothetical protein